MGSKSNSFSISLITTLPLRQYFLPSDRSHTADMADVPVSREAVQVLVGEVVQDLAVMVDLMDLAWLRPWRMAAMPRAAARVVIKGILYLMAALRI
jgi:hypothetical protein